MKQNMHPSIRLQAVVSFSEVITKYSNFVSFPIFLNGRRLNTLQVNCSDSALIQHLIELV